MSNDDERIRQLYKDMTTDDLVSRLGKSDISDGARAIGMDELGRRDLGPEVTASIREFADKAIESKSAKRWLWWLIVIPLYAIYRYYFRSQMHM